jgi:hypothetical protein
VIIALSSILLIFTELGNNVHALHVKVAFFHTLVIHACVLYSSTSRLRTADLREMKAYILHHFSQQLIAENRTCPHALSMLVLTAEKGWSVGVLSHSLSSAEQYS